MFGLRAPEMIIILVVLLLVFGPKKLPQLGESLGKGLRAFKRAGEHGIVGDDEAEPPAKDEPPKTKPAQPDSAAGKPAGTDAH